MGVWDGMGFTALQRGVIKMLFLIFLLHIGMCTANKDGWMDTSNQHGWVSGCISGHSNDYLETNMKSNEDEDE
jgi:hypothetical protein